MELEGIFDKYTSYACNIDCAVTDPGTGCDTDDCTTVPDTGYFTPDYTPSYPDAPTTDDTTTNTDTSITDDSVSEYEKRVVELVNVERAKYGLSPLTLNAELSAVARANILNSSYKEIGVGYVAGGNYWTQMFIG